MPLDLCAGDAVTTVNGRTLEPGYSFSKTFSILEPQITEFATLCGDDNPLHHDPVVAGASQFGGIIASGPHVMSLFTSMVAAHFSKFSPMVGTHFSFDFVAPVYPSDAIEMRWEVTDTDAVSRQKGIVVKLAGAVTDQGKDLIRGHGDILLLHE